ncbi:MAG: T9SS type A sorting domain-containing protein [Jejuia sp.]
MIIQFQDGKKACFSIKICCILVFILSFRLNAKEIYVAKNGSDSNLGTIESPYLTIAKAASQAIAGDVVYIREGVYEETLVPMNSGLLGSPIIFQAFENERVVISAMEIVNGFTNDSGSIYKANVDWDLGPRMFLLNGDTLMDLARWPNNVDGDRFSIDGKQATGGSSRAQLALTTTGYLNNNEIPNWPWEEGGTLFFFGDSRWYAWRNPVISSSAGRVDYRFDDNFAPRAHAPGGGGEFFLQGIKEALDYQNEWYFDKDTREVYIQLPGGGAPKDDSIRVSKRLNTIDYNRKNYIEIKNLAVLGGSVMMTGNNNKLYKVSSFFGAMSTGSNAGGLFTGIGAVFIPWSNPQWKNNTIERCEVAYNDGSGIRVVGESAVIKNNYVHDCNYLGTYEAPILARDGTNTKVINNTVKRGGRDCIQIINKGSEVAFNDFSQSNLIADDCALLYTINKNLNVDIHHNWFHDTFAKGDLFKAAAVYLDNDAADVRVHNNVIWNIEWSGIQINWDGIDIDVFNNTIWNTSREMGAWHKEGTAFSNVKVWNNLGSQGVWEEQADKQNNLVVGSGSFMSIENGDFTLSANSSAVDMGREISGITDGFTGAAPDVGAYEFNGDNWKAGITWEASFGPTGLGCYNIPGEQNCIDIPEDDLDVDGVKNQYDECPNTPFGSTVNTKGCPIFMLPSNNFSILTKAEDCAINNNGSITITSGVNNYDFTATITGSNLSQGFTNFIVFDNLEAGDYTVCISTTAFTEYEQCFEVTITEPERLSVTGKIDKDKKSIVYTMSGSSTYRINFNGEKFVTTSSIIELPLATGKNNISIKSEKDCQGKFEDNFFFNDVVVYPNPFKDDLTIDLGIEDRASLKIHNTLGLLIYSKDFYALNHKIELETISLKEGIYFVTVKTSSMVKKMKVLKTLNLE